MPIVAATDWGAVGSTVLVTALGSFAALWAQGAPVNRAMRVALLSTLLFVGSLLFLVGVLALATPIGISPWAPIIAGLIVVLPLWRPLRQVVARVAPIDPASPTHAVALIAVLAVLLVATASLLTAAAGQAPEPRSISLVEALAQQISLVVVSLFAVGLGLRRTWPATRQRLGLTAPTVPQLGAGLALALAAAALEQVLRRLAPNLPADRLSELLSAPWPNLPAPLALAVAAAVGLELMFRGALQPRLGILLTTLTYAAVSATYPPAPALLAVVALSVALGLLRRWASTTACIAAAATYNILVVLLRA